MDNHPFTDDFNVWISISFGDFAEPALLDPPRPRRDPQPLALRGGVWERNEATPEICTNLGLSNKNHGEISRHFMKSTLWIDLIWQNGGWVPQDLGEPLPNLVVDFYFCHGNYVTPIRLMSGHYKLASSGYQGCDLRAICITTPGFY